MRKLMSAALAAGLALSLAGCGGDGKSTSSETPSAAGTSTEASPSVAPTTDPTVVVSQDGMPTLTKDSDGKPLLAFPSSDAPKGLQISVLDEGTGREIARDDYVLVDYVGQVWGKDTPFDSSFTRGASAGFWLNKLVTGWKYTLEGHHVGSKVIISLPPEFGYGDGSAASSGIAATDTIDFYVEIHDAWDTESAGQADATPETPLADLPVTITGDIGAPITALAVKSGANEPTDVSTKIIARGAGEIVPSENAQVYINYAAVSWDGQREENSWTGLPKEYASQILGPQSIQIGIGSAFDGLAGLPVGSRVLILVPKKDADGDTTSSTPAMAVVADILATTPVTPTSSSTDSGQ